MRISDWSSDVCSSDLNSGRPIPAQGHIDALADLLDRRDQQAGVTAVVACEVARQGGKIAAHLPHIGGPAIHQIGSASCRERVCQDVSISVVAVSVKKKKT